MSDLSPIPRRRPLHPGIDDALIERLIQRFYEKARQDPDLGPVFAAAIGDDWEPHLQTMYAFWSSVMCMTGRYHGTPVSAHQALADLQPGHFAIWLGLFGETAREVCEPAVAALFLDRAEHIARSLQMAVFPSFDTLYQPLGVPR